MDSPLVELGKNLSGKAFRFGIFWNRIWSVKTPPLPCFATEIWRIRAAATVAWQLNLYADAASRTKPW
jgi:hypothetical protein